MLRAKTVNNNPYDSVLTCSEIIKKQERSFSGLTNCVHAETCSETPEAVERGIVEIRDGGH